MTDYVYLVRGCTLDDLDLLAAALDALIPDSRTIAMDVCEVTTNSPRVVQVLDALFDAGTVRPVSPVEGVDMRDHLKPTGPGDWKPEAAPDLVPVRRRGREPKNATI